MRRARFVASATLLATSLLALAAPAAAASGAPPAPSTPGPAPGAGTIVVSRSALHGSGPFAFLVTCSTGVVTSDGGVVQTSSAFTERGTLAEGPGVGAPLPGIPAGETCVVTAAQVGAGSLRAVAGGEPVRDASGRLVGVRVRVVAGTVARVSVAASFAATLRRLPTTGSSPVSLALFGLTALLIGFGIPALAGRRPRPAGLAYPAASANPAASALPET